MLERKKDYKAWLYLGIPLFLLSVFTFYPLIKTIFISVFTQYDAVENAMGSMFNLDAYRTIFRDKNFIRSVETLYC